MSNFIILDAIDKKENFYQDYYLSELNNVFNHYKNNVQTNQFTTQTNKNQEQKRILNTYIFPLCYMIYSYIYQKYNEKQVERHLYSKNNEIYHMYNYFFDYNNPIIKKVNVYYYQRFLKDKEKLNKNNGGNIYLLNNLIEEKNKISNFFNNFLIKFIKEDNNLGSKTILYKSIVEEFEIFFKNFDKIKNNLIVILNTSINSTIKRNINPYLINNNNKKITMQLNMIQYIRFFKIIF